MHRSLMLLTLAAFCCFVAGARADSDDVTFKKRGDNEKAWVRDVGIAIIKAAHGTAKKADLLKYEFSDPKAGRKDLTLKMEYYGAITGKRYVADIVVKIDSSNKDAWEALNIEYADTNVGIKHNETKVQDLIKKFNQ
jgi:hypothetical protein